MSLLLLFLGVLAAFVLVCVVAAKAFPRFSGGSEAESEQELSGVGPESGAVDSDSQALG